MVKENTFNNENNRSCQVLCQYLFGLPRHKHVQNWQNICHFSRTQIWKTTWALLPSIACNLGHNFLSRKWKAHCWMENGYGTYFEFFIIYNLVPCRVKVGENLLNIVLGNISADRLGKMYWFVNNILRKTSILDFFTFSFSLPPWGRGLLQRGWGSRFRQCRCSWTALAAPGK